jgi:hypothetical protein
MFTCIKANVYSFLRLPVNFKGIIYSTVIKYGTEDDWFMMFDKAINTSENAEKLRLLRGLAASRDLNIIR